MSVKLNRLGVLTGGLVVAFSTTAHADPSADRRGPHPTWPWLGAQLVPSPEIGAGSGAHFGLSWQLTPILYSWGLNRRLDPFRFFVVEPLTRQSGSIELYLSPEYFAHGPGARERWFGRAGLRSYFPLVQRGENLSVSLGNAYFRNAAGDHGAAYEVGAYVLYGFVGVRFAYEPGFAPARYLTTLAIRVF